MKNLTSQNSNEIKTNQKKLSNLNLKKKVIKMISSESINNYMKKDIFIRQSCRTPSLLSFLLNITLITLSFPIINLMLNVILIKKKKEEKKPILKEG